MAAETRLKPLYLTRSGGLKMQKEVAFIVDVEGLNPETDQFEMLFVNVPLKAPACYSNKSFREEFEKQHPDLFKRVPTFKRRGFTFRWALNFKLIEWR